MKKIIFSLLATIILIACQNEDENIVGNSNEPLGTVLGKITSPSGKAIPNARIFYDKNGDIYNTHSNLSGEYQIDVPTGNGELHIQTGNGKLFSSTVSISLSENETLDLRNSNTILNSTANLAFLAGAYDNIQAIITELGYEIDEVTEADITNGLDSYDALFLNCGGSFDSDGFYEGLNSFVLNGKSLYASDWSLDYLVGKSIDGSDIYLDCVDERVGGFISDDKICGTRTGELATYENNTILNQDLVNFVGNENIDILYDLPSWMQVENYANNFWEALIEDENQKALMLKSNQVEGNTDDSIWYSDNGNKVTICHIPPGNPDNAHPITISVNALDAHLAHGDTIGDCDALSGNIYYTTFHNHAGEETNPIIVQMMEYIILNL